MTQGTMLISANENAGFTLEVWKDKLRGWLYCMTTEQGSVTLSDNEMLTLFAKWAEDHNQKIDEEMRHCPPSPPGVAPWRRQSNKQGGRGSAK